MTIKINELTGASDNQEGISFHIKFIFVTQMKDMATFFHTFWCMQYNIMPHIKTKINMAVLNQMQVNRLIITCTVHAITMYIMKACFKIEFTL